MNQQRATYACTALMGTNKGGVVKPDSDGYYTLVLGGLNVYNSGGAYYPLASAQRVFDQSSSLMRRIASGNCRGEYGHPKKTPGMTMRDFLARVSTIDEDKVCCHFSEVTLDMNALKDRSGRPIVAVIGKVKPSGPRGEILREQLENGKENVCFSVRSLTDDRVEAGQLVKHIRSIVCWDYVNEGGIHEAQKYLSPALESYDDFSFTYEQLASVDTTMVPGVSMESGGGVDSSTLISDLGWKADARTGLVLPPSARW